jgi:hypothetical protein
MPTTSVRISDSTKKALEKEAAKERRSTAALVDIILGDWLQSRLTGAPRKYLTPDEQLAAGGKLMDMLLPNGKTLGESTAAELEAFGDALLAAGEKIKARGGRDQP